MSRSRPVHSEAFFHWIWENLHFDTETLETTDGQSIILLDPGRANPSDGPDFLQARFHTGGLTFCGAVELHLHESDWDRHGHQHDPAYNRVVLHVVLNPDASCAVRRADGSQPLVLNLRPWLHQDLRRMIARFNLSTELPCAGNVSLLNERALRKQIKRAQTEYFTEKTDRLIEWYPADIGLEAAWKQMLTLGLFDSLGIHHNREAMYRLALRLLQDQPPRDRILQHALELAASEEPPLQWRSKGVRPANRPERRIPQGCGLLLAVEELDLHDFITKPLPEIWQSLLDRASLFAVPGPQRSGVLYSTVFLPASWLLGSLWAASGLKTRAFQSWKNYRGRLPESVTKIFDKTKIKAEIYRRNLGTVFQLRHYCRGHRCQECEVLKNALGS